MNNQMHKETVSKTLWDILVKLMDLNILKEFRLVGGTSLSLMLGHRISVDIDMFTDAEYGSINFTEIYKKLKHEFEYVSNENWTNETSGNSCFIGNTEDDAVKLDLFYTDKFVYPIHTYENIRLSKLEEIAAMKLEIIGTGGRKKDFWDIHALMEYFSIHEMIEQYLKRNPYGHSKEEISSQLLNFEEAENDPDPKCLKENYWELIKLDIEETLE